MTIQYSKILNKQLLSQESGKKVETVDDVIVDQQGKRVTAFLVSKGGLLSGSYKIIQTQNILTIGEDAVMIQGESGIQEVDKKSVENLVASKMIKGKKLLSEDGNQLGSVEDMLFDLHTGQIFGLVVSEGMMQSLQGNKKQLPAECITKVGSDSIMVAPGSAQKMTKSSDVDMKKEQEQSSAPSPQSTQSQPQTPPQPAQPAQPIQQMSQTQMPQQTLQGQVPMQAQTPTQQTFATMHAPTTVGMQDMVHYSQHQSPDPFIAAKATPNTQVNPGVISQSTSQHTQKVEAKLGELENTINEKLEEVKDTLHDSQTS